jgi:hypothetical protein
MSKLFQIRAIGVDAPHVLSFDVTSPSENNVLPACTNPRRDNECAGVLEE